jgi:hypothetical protein
MGELGKDWRVGPHSVVNGHQLDMPPHALERGKSGTASHLCAEGCAVPLLLQQPPVRVVSGQTQQSGEGERVQHTVQPVPHGWGGENKQKP